ncbi:Brix-domain-containing protein [Athelia psychrophila]|uniref:Brix-domain-containing protein n=1 Tax=Athelia psychrophila TaxID=1759441 RepID=A0A166M5S6_9AGAM|nr:Brix-domain-containing protein [Fibularhizoctonia sp. CBS 109695]
MARRRKNRTHLKGAADPATTAGPKDGLPKSFIIKHGQVGSSLTQLVRDMRKVMEPNTASRLKERNRNKLKDYLTMAPALHVTHLLAFTLTPIAPSLRIVRLSAGPTLSFRVERYSLVKDVLNTSKRARSIGMEYLSPPLLVLASFPPPGPATPPHLSLLMKSFQSLFPPLAPHTLTLSAARRVVLVAYNAEKGTVDFRHFVITVKPYGVSKRVRRVLEGGGKKSATSTGMLDLGNEKDVADFLLRKRGEPGPGSSTGGTDGYESAASSASSAGENEDANAINLADDYVGRGNKKGSRRAVKLDEIGPRMELRLVKITEGVPGKLGSVIYHEFVTKTKAEVHDLKAAHAAKEKLRKSRRDEQERNVQRKKAAGKPANADGDGDEEMDGSEAEDEGDEGAWDDEEEISEGEDSPAEESGDESEDEPEARPPPPKKIHHRPRIVALLTSLLPYKTQDLLGVPIMLAFSNLKSGSG